MGRSDRPETAAMTKATLTVLQLVGSLTLSVLAAIVLVKGAVYFDYRETLTLALPVLPSVFPIFYRVLAKGPTQIGIPNQAPARSSVWKGHLSLPFFAMRPLRTILVGVALSLLTKYIAEALFLYMLYRKSGLPFQILFGEANGSVLGRFLRGELLMVVGAPVVPLLLVEVLILTAVGGLWIGCTSSGSPALEGVLAGTILAFFATMTNLTILYAHAESLTRTAASLLAADYLQVFSLAGPMLQIFLYGCWAIAGQQWRRNRSSRAVAQTRRARPSRSR
jgi:hypothetical protein